MILFTFDGMSYDSAGVMELREEIIKLRDEALKQGSFDWAVKLSHTIALLAMTAKHMAECDRSS